jgi:GNAT superfamily N-acetyltransferase
VEIRSLGYRTDLMVLRAGGSVLTDRGDHLVVRTPDNPTFYWGNFVLFEQPGDLAERLALFAAEFPDAEHVAFGIDSTDGTAGDEAELTAAGFTIGRDIVMTATEIAEPARPNTTAKLRPLRTDDDWAQQVDLRRATSDFDDDEPHRAFVRAKVAGERRMAEAGTATWFGAFEDDRLVSSLGLVTTEYDPELARYQSVGTVPDARGRGLASALVHHAGRYAFDELGVRRLVMIADPEYLAIRIYRALGFTDGETQVQLTRAPATTG